MKLMAIWIVLVVLQYKVQIKISGLTARPGISLYDLSNYIPQLKEVLSLLPNRKDEITEAAEIKNEI